MKIKTRITLLLLLVAVISLGGCNMAQGKENQSENEYENFPRTQRIMEEIDAQVEEYSKRAEVYITEKYPDDVFTRVHQSTPNERIMSYFYESKRFPDERIIVRVSLKSGEYHYNDDYVKYLAGEDFANKLEPQLTQIFGEEYRVRLQFTGGANTTDYAINTTAEEFIVKNENPSIWLQVFIKERPEEERIVLEEKFMELMVQQNIDINSDIRYVAIENWNKFNEMSLGTEINVKRNRLMRGTHNIDITQQKNGEIKIISRGEWEGERYERAVD